MPRPLDTVNHFSYPVSGAALTLRPFSNISNGALKWLSPTAVIYGATVQLAVEQCRVGDSFTMTATNATGTTQ